MGKINFHDFEIVISCNFIEVSFCVDNSEEYQNAWLGKMMDSETEQEVFWYGLTPDGSQAYDFATFDDFVNAKVFQGKSIKEIWGSISIFGLGGAPPEEMLPLYLERSKEKLN